MTDLVDYLRDKLEHADAPATPVAETCSLRWDGFQHVRWHVYRSEPTILPSGESVLKCVCGFAEWSAE